jgi:small-conductance mechanosensitive channel
MEETDHIRDAVRMIWGHRRDILKWTTAVLVVTALLSLLLKNYYKATTTFYPASLDLSKPDHIFGNSVKELEFYGSNQDLDRLLTICHSNDLKDRLISEFNLYQHYDIDSTRPLAHHKIRLKLEKLMDITKTKYDAIDLSIEDHDKELAAKMANRARDIVNTSSHQLIADKLNEVINTYASSIEQMQSRMSLLNDSLTILRKTYPIYNIQSQTEMMANIATQTNNDLVGEQARYDALKSSNAPKDTLMYLLAKIKGLQSQIKSISGGDHSLSFNLSNFNEGVSKVLSITQSLERLQNQLNEDRVRYQQTLNTMQSGAHAIITVSRYLITAVGLVAALDIIGIGWDQVQWLVAALGLGLGFGLKEIFSNFFSGLILLLERPIRVGDTVTLDQLSGTVSRINIRATTITDWDRKEIIVPNNTFITGSLINWARSDPITRVVIPVGVGYDSDPARVQEVLLAVATAHPLVTKEPAPAVLFLKFGESALEFEVRVFVRDLANRLPVTHDLHNGILRALRAHRIEMPFPQREVRLRGVSAEPRDPLDQYSSSSS